MTSTLAQQLASLQIKQRDEVALPTRTKMSFLFDIKQAANIDDQTLFFICQSGVEQLAHDTGLSLESFAQDIFSQQSLSFYRGTETEETLLATDAKLELLIKHLAPHLMNEGAHKIVEYLIRIYEVHIHHKNLILKAFLPYFETVFFLRLIQCLNLKNDEIFQFLHQFAYEGTAIDRKTLVKAISRNSGLVFVEYGEFCISLVPLQQSSNSFHWKFFGAMLSDVLATPTADETLMFNLLPLIAKAIQQDQVRELRLASFLAMSQIVCRRSLSAEYSQAFAKQVLRTITESTAEFDEEIKLKGLTVLLFIVQNQAEFALSKRDFTLLAQVSRLPKLLQMLAESFDCSSLAQVAARSVLNNDTIPTDSLKPVLSSLIKANGQANLKTAFSVAQTVINAWLSSEQLENGTARARQVLHLVKATDQDLFQQCVVFILKQLNDDPVNKEKVLHLLSNADSKSQLVCRFGDKEFSILSALGSARKATATSALEAVSKEDFVAGLSEHEKQLVKIVLLQLIAGELHEEATLLKMLAAVQVVNKATASSQDIDFECLHSVLNQASAYSQKVVQALVNMLLSLQTTQEQNQHKQAWVLFFYHSLAQKIQVSTLLTNPFCSYFIDKKHNKLCFDSAFYVKKMVAQPQKCASLILSAFRHKNSFVCLKQVATLVQTLGQSVKHDLLSHTFIGLLYIPILRELKTKLAKNANEVFSAILKCLPTQAEKSLLKEKLIFKCVSKLLGASVLQKQINPSKFDLAAIHKQLTEEFFLKDKQALAEFFILVATESKFELKQVFAVMSLTQMHLTSCVDHKIMAGVILVLLNSPSKQVRLQTLQLAEALLKAQTGNSDQVSVFTNTEKPISVTKHTQNVLTPMKSGSVSKLLTELLKFKPELTADNHQLQTVLNKYKQPEVFEELLRSLLDYPDFQSKQKLVQVLALVRGHSTNFSINLGQILEKLIVLAKEDVKRPDVQSFLSVLGELIINLQRESANPGELLTSLTMPLLTACLDFQVEEKVDRTRMTTLSKTLVAMFETCLFSETTMSRSVETRVQTQIMRLFLKSQKTECLFTQTARQSLSGFFVKQMATLPSKRRQELAFALLEAGQTNEVSSIEHCAQILLQVRVQSASLVSKLLQVLQQVIQLPTEESAFSVDLLCQLIQQSLDPKHKVGEQELHMVWSLVEKTLSVLQREVLLTVQTKEKANDAFAQFVEDEKDDVSMESVSDHSLLPATTSLTSLFTLLSRLEEKPSLTRDSLKNLGLFLESVVDMTDSDEVSNDKLEECITHLAGLHQSLALKAIHNQAEGDDGYSFKELLLDYLLIAEVLLEKDHVHLSRNGDNALAIIKSLPGSFSNYGALACIILLGLAVKEAKINLKHDVLVDCDTPQKSGGALFLVQKVLLASLDEALASELNLLCLQNLVMLIYAMPLDLAQQQVYQKANKALFKHAKSTHSLETLQSLSSWVRIEVLKEKPKKVRQTLFLSMLMLNQWLGPHSYACKTRLATIAGTEKPSESVQEQMVAIFLALYSMQDCVSRQVETSEDKKALLRLKKKVEQVQYTFNNCLSVQIHVEIVLQVMGFGERADTSPMLISLKQNALQLLIAKISSFSRGYISRAKQNLQQTFFKLVESSLRLLEEYKPELSKQNAGSLQLCQCLFTIIARTACSKTMPGHLQTQPLTTILSFRKTLDSQTEKNTLEQMQLETQMLLTEMNLFEEYNLQILDHFQAYFEHVTSGFEKLRDSPKMIFAEQFRLALWKASLSVVQIFLKFLSVQQLESLLTHVINSSPKSEGDEVVAVLQTVTQPQAVKDNKKTFVHACMNVFQNTVGQAETPSRITVCAHLYFSYLLTPLLKNLPQDFVQSSHSKLFSFFKKAIFPLPFKIQKQHQTANVAIEQAVSDSFSAFVVKLNEDQLRGMVVKIVKWGTKKECDVKKMTMFQLFNAVLKTLREFFVPLLHIYFNNAVLPALEHSIKSLSLQTKGKRQREQMEEDLDHTTIERLLAEVCLCLQLNFKHDVTAYIQNDLFEALCDPVSSLVTILGHSNFLQGFIKNSLKPLVLEMDERIRDDNMWMKLNYAFLMQTRSDHWQVRLATLDVIEFLFESMRERFLVVLNDTIPFISELLEDEHEQVEATAKRIVNNIEQLTGESINEYLK